MAKLHEEIEKRRFLRRLAEARRRYSGKAGRPPYGGQAERLPTTRRPAPRQAGPKDEP